MNERLDTGRTDYERETRIRGDVPKALELSLNTFVQLGFAIEENGPAAQLLRGPGMTNSRQGLLRGVSLISLRVSGDTLRVRANFGAVRRLWRFVALFLGGLAVFFLVLFSCLFGGRENMRLATILLISFAPFCPWPILVPVLMSVQKRSTAKALDTLIDNMVKVAGSLAP